MNKNNKQVLDTKYRQGLLFDFYGELLKENNHNIYEDYIINDLSLSEIAEEYGISRQGIHDTIKRATKQLEEYDNKLNLIEKYKNINEKALAIQTIIDEVKNTKNIAHLDKIHHLLEDIINET